MFQERFKSEAVEDETYLLTVLRYIHQNPVKAGEVKNVDEYKWSSYREYVNKPSITDTDFILQIISSDRQKAMDSFISFTNEQNEDKCLDYVEKVRLTDNEVGDYLLRQGISCISELQSLERHKRDEIIRKLKEINGVTIRQLSRVTGISKSVIDRI